MSELLPKSGSTNSTFSGSWCKLFIEK